MKDVVVFAIFKSSEKKEKRKLQPSIDILKLTNLLLIPSSEGIQAFLILKFILNPKNLLNYDLN